MSIIQLSPDLLAKCTECGELRVKNYAAGLSNASLSLQWREAASNPKLQAMSIVAECGFAIWHGIDPYGYINWSGHADQGTDIEWLGVRVDIKSALPGRKLLIWPVTKNHLYGIKEFDILIFIQADPETGECRIGDRCWTSKRYFAAHRQVAGEGNQWRLDPGTRFMHEKDLWPRADLERFDLAGVAIRIGNVAEYVTGSSMREYLSSMRRTVHGPAVP